MNTKISAHLNYFFLNITRKIHGIYMHVYDDDGEIIVHKISTPLAPKFNDLQKEIDYKNKKKFLLFNNLPKMSISSRINTFNK